MTWLTLLAGLAPVVGPQAQRPDSPQGMPLPLAGVVFMLMAATVVLIVVSWRKRRRGGPGGYRKSGLGTSVGNALLDMNATFMPNHADAAVICKLEEEEERDEAGDQRTP